MSDHKAQPDKKKDSSTAQALSINAKKAKFCKTSLKKKIDIKHHILQMPVDHPTQNVAEGFYLFFENQYEFCPVPSQCLMKSQDCEQPYSGKQLSVTQEYPFEIWAYSFNTNWHEEICFECSTQYQTIQSSRWHISQCVNNIHEFTRKIEEPQQSGNYKFYMIEACMNPDTYQITSYTDKNCPILQKYDFTYKNGTSINNLKLKYEATCQEIMNFQGLANSYHLSTLGYSCKGQILKKTTTRYINFPFEWSKPAQKVIELTAECVVYGVNPNFKYYPKQGCLNPSIKPVESKSKGL